MTPRSLLQKSFCLLVLALPTTSLAEELPRLRVGLAGSPPFVLPADGGYTGMSVEVFEALAEEAKLSYEFVRIDTGVTPAIDKVVAGELDLAVGPISITAGRLERVRFTHGYYRAALSVVTATPRTSIADVLRPFASRSFLYGVGVLLGALLVVGTLIWLAERKANAAQFPPGAASGIGNGVWFALVTLTTVGYGDRAPVTFFGRVLAGVWMIIALVGASSLTAGIATALTLESLDRASIEHPSELRKRKVAASAGTTAEEFARQNRAQVVPTPDTRTALKLLEEGKVDAVMSDRPILLYLMRSSPATDLVLAKVSWMPQGYGFALPLDSTLDHRLNLAIQKLRESGKLREIEQRWLGEDE